MNRDSKPIRLWTLEGHPANRLIQALLSYGSTKDILSMNCFEVLRFIEAVESGRFSDVALDNSRRMEYRDFENHMVRYFHNFLAGAKTLVEHTRNMMKSDFISDKHRAAYRKQVEEIFSDDLGKFVGDFRNYTLHFGLPKIAHICSIPEKKWEVSLILKDLRTWGGWTVRGRRFIEAHPDEIRLAWLVASYEKKAISLHEWLARSFTDHYGDTFHDFDRLRAAALANPIGAAGGAANGGQPIHSEADGMPPAASPHR